MIGQVCWGEKPSIFTATMHDDGAVEVTRNDGSYSATYTELFAEEHARASFGPADGDPRAAFLSQMAQRLKGTVTLVAPAQRDLEEVIY